MQLTEEEKEILSGRRGEALEKAMEIVTALGEIYGADRLVPIRSAQIAGVSYKNIGDAGLELIEDFAKGGARVQVMSTLNPAGMDLKFWKDMGVPPKFAAKQKRIIDAYGKMGILTTCTCTPYDISNIALKGDHVAWSESSAVVFVNSVFGARTNREGGPSSLASGNCLSRSRCLLAQARTTRSWATISVKSRARAYPRSTAQGPTTSTSSRTSPQGSRPRARSTCSTWWT
jgi:predicted aconitase